MESIAAKIEAVMPALVRNVCAQLSQAGFEALCVGGAVRDAMLGRDPGDWDIATSAHPDEVMALFKHTIATGLQHGTVTVVVGRGDDRQAIEVTTFRGDGDYSDCRRPDSVVFGVPLEQDLARRDFVVNAMAYDPLSRLVVDPFGGVDDLHACRLRAVGDARQRFAEDGLRVMRAIRFAAVLEFDLDPATEAAIAGALPSLANVSCERVRAEMLKLLTAAQPSRGLDIGQRTGVFSVAVDSRLDIGATAAPDVAARWRHTLRFVDAATDPLVRFAALLGFGEHDDADEVNQRMRELTLSNDERVVVVHMYRATGLWRELPMEDTAVRRYLGRVGRVFVPHMLELLRAQATAFGSAAQATSLDALVAQIDMIVDRGDALVAKELCLSGGDIIRLLDIEPGKVVGELVARLLDRVLAQPQLNEPAALEAVLHTEFSSLARR